MKKMIFVITFLFLKTQAYAMTDKECIKSNLLYGDEKKHQPVQKECENLFMASAVPEAVKVSEDGNIKIWGYKNMLVVDRKNSKGVFKRSYITGKYPKLEEVTAIDIDVANDEVAVLDAKNGRILYYSMTITGNIAPFRILNSKKAFGASDLVINPEAEQVIILHAENREVYFYSRKANAMSMPGKRNQKLQRLISDLPTGLIKPEIDISQNVLTLMQRETKQFHVYPLTE